VRRPDLPDLADHTLYHQKIEHSPMRIGSGDRIATCGDARAWTNAVGHIDANPDGCGAIEVVKSAFIDLELNRGGGVRLAACTWFATFVRPSG